MKITVRIDVDVEGANGANPNTLTWTKTITEGDNPRYWIRPIQRAIKAASAHAIGRLESFVDYRDGATQRP